MIITKINLQSKKKHLSDLAKMSFFFYYVLEEILNEVVKIKFSSKVTKTVFDCGFSFLLDPSASSKFFRCPRDYLLVYQCT